MLREQRTDGTWRCFRRSCRRSRCRRHRTTSRGCTCCCVDTSSDRADTTLSLQRQHSHFTPQRSIVITVSACVCVCVCVRVCLSAIIIIIFGTARSIFTIFMHVDYGRCSVLLRQRNDLMYFRFCGWRHICTQAEAARRRRQAEAARLTRTQPWACRVRTPADSGSSGLLLAVRVY